MDEKVTTPKKRPSDAEAEIFQQVMKRKTLKTQPESCTEPSDEDKNREHLSTYMQKLTWNNYTYDLGTDWENIDEFMPDTKAEDKEPYIWSSASRFQQMQINTALEFSKRVHDGLEKVSMNADLRNEISRQGSTLCVSDKEINANFKKFDLTVPFFLNFPRTFDELKYRYEHKIPKLDKEELKAATRLNLNGIKLPISPLLKLSRLLNQGSTIESPVPTKNVIQRFTNNTKMVDVEVSVDGTTKVVKAYMDGPNMLLPCTGKNCIAVTDEHHKRTSSCSDDGDSGGVYGAFPSFASTPTQGEREGDEAEEDTSQIPMITSVTSLATPKSEPELGIGLSPLASQVPYPVPRKSPVTGKYGQSPTKISPSASASGLVTNKSVGGISRLNNLLDKPVVQQLLPHQLKKIKLSTPELEPLPIILIPSNNANRRKTNPAEVATDHPVCSYIPILPKGVPRIIPGSVTGSKVVQTGRSQALGINSPRNQAPRKAIPRIDNVYSTVQIPMEEQEVQSPENNFNMDEGGLAMDEIQLDENNGLFQFLSAQGGADGADSNVNPNEEDYSETGGIRLSNTIFEPSGDQEYYEDVEVVPRIMSTSSGASVIPGTKAKNIGNITVTTASQRFVPEQKLILAKQEHQLRMNMTAATIAEKAKHPIRKKTTAGELLGCRTCGKTFPASCQAMYKNHMLTKHAVKIDGNEVVLNKVPGASTMSSEWHKCLTCDQLMTSGEKMSHKSRCCPQLPDNLAFSPFHCATSSTGAMPLFCGLCDKAFDSRIGLRQHLTGFHKDITQKLILDPSMRCSSCLLRFEDSIALTLHCSTCTTRRASEATMLELAKGVLDCEICGPASHASINETQQCYVRTGVIRCLLCHNTVLTRGNFFHHIRTYHHRHRIGIICPFCDAGEMPIKDCFTHIIDEHYTPILEREGIVAVGAAGAKRRSYPFHDHDPLDGPVVFNTTTSSAAASVPATISTTQTSRISSHASSTPGKSSLAASTPGISSLRPTIPVKSSVTSPTSGISSLRPPIPVKSSVTPAPVRRSYPEIRPAPAKLPILATPPSIPLSMIQTGSPQNPTFTFTNAVTGNVLPLGNFVGRPILVNNRMGTIVRFPPQINFVRKANTNRLPAQPRFANVVVSSSPAPATFLISQPAAPPAEGSVSNFGM